jgi:hypothetical protein
MFLESQSRRIIQELKISSLLKDFTLRFLSDSFDHFLAGNDQHKVLELATLTLSDNACEIIGRMPHRLEVLELRGCQLNLERLVVLLGANPSGPTRIKLEYCTMRNQRVPGISFSSILIPLLANPMTKAIDLSFFTSFKTNCSAIKASLETNQGLEELHIDGDLGLQTVNVLLFFKG